jgi:nucleotide-binding universal stress UspA family protein
MYKRIMVIVDETPNTDIAVSQGVEMAKAHHAEVLFFYVLPRYVLPMVDALPVTVQSPEEFQREANDSASKVLHAASAVADTAGVTSHRAMGSGVDDAHCVADAARIRHCDLIVVAAERRNAVVRLITGNIIPGLITHAGVPVLVCQGALDAH